MIGDRVWRSVVGYDGLYEVSDDGLVRSLDRTIMRNGLPKRLRGKLISQTEPRNRPPYKSLSLSKGGTVKCWKVHRLVALAFIRNPRGCNQINHIDGNPRNNASSNLEWCTATENAIHSFRVLGRDRLIGERKGNAVLSEADAMRIKNYCAAGIFTQILAAKEYGVAPSTVSQLVRGKTWRHLG